MSKLTKYKPKYKVRLNFQYTVKAETDITVEAETPEKAIQEIYQRLQQGSLELYDLDHFQLGVGGLKLTKQVELTDVIEIKRR